MPVITLFFIYVMKMRELHKQEFKFDGVDLFLFVAGAAFDISLWVIVIQLITYLSKLAQ